MVNGLNVETIRQMTDEIVLQIKINNILEIPKFISLLSLKIPYLRFSPSICQMIN
jgi:hypothetical protein